MRCNSLRLVLSNAWKASVPAASNLNGLLQLRQSQISRAYDFFCGALIEPTVDHVIALWLLSVAGFQYAQCLQLFESQALVALRLGEAAGIDGICGFIELDLFGFAPILQ